MTTTTENPQRNLLVQLGPWLLAFLLLGATGSPARAQLQFCNDFERPVRFALAYQTPEGWVSEGWTKVESKGCVDTGDKYAGLTELYWSGETDWYKIEGGKRQQVTWGKGREFSVKDQSFTFKNADKKQKGARLAGFNGPITIKTPSSVTVSIQADRTSMVVTSPIKPKDSASSDADYKVCQDASGDEALAACDRAIASGKFSGHQLASLHLNRGVERGRKGDNDGRLADYTKAIEIDPKFALAYRNRGVAYEDRGDYDAALKDFDQSIQLAPDDYVSYVRRGDIYRKKGERDLAIADYTKALSLNPSDKDRQSIQTSLDRLDPDFQKCEKSSGEEALAACDRAIASGKFKDSLLAALYINRGVERRNKDDIDGAIADYTMAIGLDVKSALAFANRGRAYYTKGDYDAAIKDLGRSIELDPDDASVYARRGDCYRKKGDKEHAIADYNKALALKPDDKTKEAVEAALKELGS